MSEKELTKIPISELSDDEFVDAFSIQTLKARSKDGFYFTTFGAFLECLAKTKIISFDRFVRLRDRENTIK
jgi:hypothetical protein